jgi:hypothetical protein
MSTDGVQWNSDSIGGVRKCHARRRASKQRAEGYHRFHGELPRVEHEKVTDRRRGERLAAVCMRVHAKRTEARREWATPALRGCSPPAG